VLKLQYGLDILVERSRRDGQGKVLECVPQEKCKGGRPRRGWRVDIKEATGARDIAKEDRYRREGRRLGAEQRQRL
jgi:hypothetical protein